MTNFQQILVFECETFGKVTFIESLNSSFDQQYEIQFNFQAISILNLIYSIETKIIYLKQTNFYPTKILVQNLELINNTVNKEQLNINNQLGSLESLIDIELQQVTLNFIYIKRNFGITEFIFSNVEQLKIKNFQATQISFHKLHQFFDCSDLKTIQYYSKQLIQGFDVKESYFQYFDINQMNFIDTPMIQLLQLLSYNLETRFYQNFQDFNVSNTILIITKNYAQTSLFQISLNSKVYINFMQCNIINNQLHSYLQNQFLTSAIIFLINSPSGTIQLFKNFFSKNFVTNSTDTILYIVANEILINQTIYSSNSYFNSEIFQSNIESSFYDSFLITEKMVKQIFPLISFIGNGYYQAMNIIISNCNIENSNSKNGVGFYIQAIDSILTNITFSNLSTYFEFNEENGGCIYFYIPSNNCRIQILNVLATSITTKDFGAFIYIESNNENLNFQMLNLTLYNIFSLKGSILFSIFLIDTMNNKILMSDINLENSYAGMLQYFQNDLENSKLIDFLQNRVLIYLESSQLQIHNFYVKNNFEESFLSVQKSGDCILSQIDIQFGSVNQLNYIDININQMLNVKIIFNNVNFRNTSLIEKQQILCSEQKTLNFSSQFQMQCSNLQNDINSQQDNITVISDNLNEKKINSQCKYQQLQLKNLENYNSLIAIQLNETDHKILIKNLLISNLTFEVSQFGLLYFKISQQKQQKYNPYIRIEKLFIINNNCGKVGCLYIGPNFFNIEDYQNLSLQRLLEGKTKQQQIYEMYPDIVIKSYNCFQNIGEFGTCLFAKQVNILIQSSDLQKNKALAGGAIFFEGTYKFLYIQNSIIQQNTAIQGGGIFYKDMIAFNQTQLQTSVLQNFASYCGNEIIQLPSHLTITLNF